MAPMNAISLRRVTIVVLKNLLTGSDVFGSAYEAAGAYRS